MKSIERVVAEGTGKGGFIANGAFGHVYKHGDKRVYKESWLDGTAVWLERCFAIQKRLGMDHPLCYMMPEIFAFRLLTEYRYAVVMAKYRRVYLEFEAYRGTPEPEIANTFPSIGIAEAVVDAVLGCEPGPYGGTTANDLHRGNILYCDKRGWIITDPSSLSYKGVSKGKQDPKFSRAKRVATQYGQPCRH